MTTTPKSVPVTWAARGIGLAIARLFLMDEWRIAMPTVDRGPIATDTSIPGQMAVTARYRRVPCGTSQGDPAGAVGRRGRLRGAAEPGRGWQVRDHWWSAPQAQADWH
ncbi:MAG: hypothetical protein AAF415_05785 [Pseudomonadota bacterium]